MQQQQPQQPEVRTLLLRHQASLHRELEASNLLSALLKRGVISDSERQRLAASLDVQLLVELLQTKGFEAFSEFCFALEAECPHVLTDLLVDQHAITETEKHEQQKQQSNQSNQQQQDSIELDLKHASSDDEAKKKKKKNESDSPPGQLPPPQPPPPPATSSCKDNLQQHHHHENGNDRIPTSEPGLEMLDEPVDEPVSGNERGWEVHQVTVTRVPGYGFGIAVSGGRDNPHFSNGDPAIAISDVLKAGPAEGKLQVNDRIISANGVSLEGADYGAAVRVLRDSGSTVLLVVRRRAGASEPPGSGPGPTGLNGPGASLAGSGPPGSPGCPAGCSPGGPQPAGPPAAQSHRLSLSRPSKKDDFGIVLGCRLYVREVTREGTGARPGDLVTRIAGMQADNMSLKEARKLMEQSKDRLSLVVSREPAGLLPGPDSGPGKSLQQQQRQQQQQQLQQQQQQQQQQSGYASQNLYVPPPTRLQAPPPPPPPPPAEDKSNLAPRGRSRGPLVDPVSLSQLDLPATPTQEPPRPPPPRPEDYYGSRRQIYEEEALAAGQPGGRLAKQPMPDPRFITFQKEGSVGVRLTGGNETGVFVNAVQPGSPASLQGLQPGDKILKVNDMDMKGVTREEAVLFLLSLQEQIDLIVQHRRHEYEQIVSTGKGDSFHIKTHFHYEHPEKGEMSFRSGDVFHVVDTLHNGVVGAWQVYRIGRNNQEVQKGIIPNKARAEELATAQFNATKKELSASESRGSFFRRRRGSHRRSKSLGRDHWDDVVFSDSVSKFPAYERVVLRHPGFIRPVVLFGPVADLAREKLLKDFPDKFTCPQTESQTEEGSSKSTKTSGIIRLSAIREVMERGKHALLDITPNAVDRLNYAQFYPIVIFLKAENKQIIKEMRAGIPKSAHKSSKKLLEQCQKLDKIWGHVFSAVVTLTSPESWYRKLRELIDWQQQSPLWMSQTKPEEALSDDFLFPMTSRLSYASSPESDLELSPAPSLPGTLGVPSRLKSSSDPSIATQDDAVAPPPYTTSYQVSQLLHSPSAEQQRAVAAAAVAFQAAEGLLPQHRRTRSHQPQQHHPQQQQQQHHSQQQQQQQQGPPQLPPRVDRNSKPTGSYDSMSSYDSYNTNGTMAYPNSANLGPSSNPSNPGRLGPNVPDDLKSSNMAMLSRPHDPYKFTRSTAIPVQESQTRTDYAKYSRTGDYKSVPAPPSKSSGTYKPVPPPKPKNYRPPQQPIIQDENSGNSYQHAKSYSMGTPHMMNGAENGVNMQRNNNNNNNQYYYNIISPSNRNMQNSDGYSVNSNHAHNHMNTNAGSHNHSISHSHPLSSSSMLSHSHSSSSGQIGVAHSHSRSNVTMNGHSHSNSHSGISLQNSIVNNSNSSNHTNGNSNIHNRESSTLDLAGSREQRGSAFELYRKPLHHHNIR